MNSILYLNKEYCKNMIYRKIYLIGAFSLFIYFIYYNYINFLSFLNEYFFNFSSVEDGDWGLGPIPNPQSPIPNPQSPLTKFKI